MRWKTYETAWCSADILFDFAQCSVRATRAYGWFGSPTDTGAPCFFGAAAFTFLGRLNFPAL